ncbi:MAG: AmmeMemoRadiSam system radical SAM enzyme [Syntrophotaleaceae bacterium]
MHEALFWEKEKDNRVRCSLCRFRCLISDGRRGRCGVRENQRGTLYTLVYGKSIAENIDPIEKKPLFHYHPGSLSYSIATVGCNFRCLHCQNYTISQWPQDQPVTGLDLPPAEIVRRAAHSGCRSIAYTYTEPTIYFEYAYDTAVLARERGLGNIFVTNGYITPEALEKIAPYLDAANVDLKGYSEQFYREVTGAELQGVLETLLHYRKLGIWLEVTTLIIPGRNDDTDQLRDIARFIAGQLGTDTPWHITAFHPAYRMSGLPRTPPETLYKARDIGLQAGLKYVYEGNLINAREDTLCPGCGKAVIERDGFRLKGKHLEKGFCEFCRTEIPGIGL